MHCLIVRHQGLAQSFVHAILAIVPVARVKWCIQGQIIPALQEPSRQGTVLRSLRPTEVRNGNALPVWVASAASLAPSPFLALADGLAERSFAEAHFAANQSLWTVQKNAKMLR